MKTLSYILLLAAIYGNIAQTRRKELTIHNTKTVMDYLIAQDQIDIKRPFSLDISCSNKSFKSCYEDLHTYYDKVLSKEIYLMYKETLTEKLIQYKIAVSLLVSGRIKYYESFVDTMLLNESSLYCAIGALSLHKDEDIQINDLLNDYIFFSDENLLLSYNKGPYYLKLIVSVHFDTSLYTKEVNKQWGENNDIDYSVIKDHFKKLKEDINSYCLIFCELQSDLRLTWMKADTWTWERIKKYSEFYNLNTNSINLLSIAGLVVEFETDILNKNKYTYFDSPIDLSLNEQDPKYVDSTIRVVGKTDLTQKEDSAAYRNEIREHLSPKMEDNANMANDTEDSDHRVRKLKNILNWKLSDDDQANRVNNLPGVKKERNENFTPIKLKSLSEYIKTRNTNHQDTSVERYYHSMSLTVDMVVSKVLFPRILHFGTRAMDIYYADMQNDVEDKDYRFFQQFYIGEQLLIFKRTLKMFFTIQPFTFHKETVIDMLKILDFLVKSYMFHIQKKSQPTDPTESIKHIHLYFEDIRFIQDSVEASKNIQSIQIDTWDNVYDAVNKCVSLMIHLTKIKKPE